MFRLRRGGGVYYLRTRTTAKTKKGEDKNIFSGFVLKGDDKISYFFKLFARHRQEMQEMLKKDGFTFDECVIVEPIYNK